MKVKMLVAAHKEYKMPLDKELYVPIFVGSDINKNRPSGYQADNTGKNISSKNPNYNELTAIYWAWKNLDADIIGLNHYRRYFVDGRWVRKDFKHILNESAIVDKLKNNDVIVSKKRKYFIETIESHYVHSHDLQGITALKKVFKELDSNYKNALDSVLSSRSAHMFNMFIMKKSDFDNYCEWLFGILDEVEKNIDFSKLEGNEKRVMGFVSELLLDVWIKANNKRIIEQPVKFMENNHWIKKILVFLLNKITGGHSIINTHIR